MTPRPSPTAFPTPSQNAAALMGEEGTDVEMAFADEIEELIANADYLSTTPCAALAEAVRSTPQIITELQTYARTLRRLADNDQVLSGQRTQQVLGEWEEALADLDRSLGRCGVTLP